MRTIHASHVSGVLISASAWGRQICDLAVGAKKSNRQIADLATCKSLNFSRCSLRTVLYAHVVHKQTVDSQVITSQNEIICRQKIEQFVE